MDNDYRTAKQRIDEILSFEEEQAAWEREQRLIRRHPEIVRQREIGEIYGRWLNFGPSALTRAEMTRLRKEGPRFGFKGHTTVRQEKE